MNKNILKVCLLLLFVAQLSAQVSKRPLDLRICFETPRTMEPVKFLFDDRESSGIVVSPDGQKYVLTLVSGDVNQDGVWMEIIGGSLTSIEAAAPRTLAKLFTRAFGGGFENSLRGAAKVDSTQLLLPGFNVPIWIDNRTVAFRWEDKAGAQQWFAVDWATSKLSQVTDQRTGVVSVPFLSSDGKGRLIYGGSAPVIDERSEEMMKSGFVVAAPDFISLLNRKLDGSSHLKNMYSFEYFIADRNSSTTRRVEFPGMGPSVWPPITLPQAIFSPDGLSAVVERTVAKLPLEWKTYEEMGFAAWVTRSLSSNRGKEEIPFRQLFLVDVMKATARPLWTAPSQYDRPIQVAWSPSGSSVVLGPTFLPPESTSPAGKTGQAVAELDIRTGSIRELPSTGKAVLNINWQSDSEVTLTESGGKEEKFVRIGNLWTLIEPKESEALRSETKVRVFVAESPHSPPVLTAENKQSQQRRELRALMPDIEKYDLGYAEWFSVDAPDVGYEAMLFYPRNYQPGSSYPLVFQLHSPVSRSRFSLYGPSDFPAGPGEGVQLGRVLAAKGCFVLQGAAVFKDKVPRVTKGRTTLIRSLELAADELVRRGLVDPARIGISGFSAGGNTVLNTLVHSKIKFAAAVTLDNTNGSMLEDTLMGWNARNYGAPPFGNGLKPWLENSISFNTERIQTPLLMMVSDGYGGLNSALLQWEVFTRLRYLQKPVEFYVAPEINKGAHGLQNPTQLLAVQNRALDWFCFWLLKVRDPLPDKMVQYDSWDQIRSLHEKDIQQPRAPLFRWERYQLN